VLSAATASPPSTGIIREPLLGGGSLIRVCPALATVGHDVSVPVPVSPAVASGDPTPVFDLRDDRGIMALYREHGPSLYRLASRSLGDRGLAEEMVQETFVRAWRAAERFDPLSGSVRTWLFAICRNLLVDAARARAVRPPLASPGDVTDRPATTDALDAIVSSWQVDEAMRELSPEHRHAVDAVLVRDRPYQEVADELGLPVGTVKSRVYYALRALRDNLERNGWDDA
jgi:RNA polymerase sigma-70 factor (ECF subfamily)